MGLEFEGEIQGWGSCVPWECMDDDDDDGDEGSVATLDDLIFTVAQLQALTGVAVGAHRLVYGPVTVDLLTFGLGAYRFSAAATATSAPYFYRATDDSGVWEKDL